MNSPLPFKRLFACFSLALAACLAMAAPAHAAGAPLAANPTLQTLRNLARGAAVQLHADELAVIDRLAHGVERPGPAPSGLDALRQAAAPGGR
jgi:hypothetical protein